MLIRILKKDLIICFFIILVFNIISAAENVFIGGDALVQKINKAVVSIYNKPEGGYKSYYAWKERSPSKGSGFFINGDGLIATNYHVVDHAKEIIVTLYDKKEYKADLVGYDKYIDFAVLKIKNFKENVTYLSFSDSDRIKVGQKAIAVGNPLGLKTTYTSGIISANHRIDLGINPIENFIQFDAEINPGNSGGPLLDQSGNVLGISSASSSRYAGLGFAVPSNLAKKSFDTIVNNQEIVYPFIGLYVLEITKENQDIYNIEETEGLYVLGVAKESSAEKNDIKFKNIIKKINNVKIDSLYDFYREFYKNVIGSTIQLEILDDKKNIKKKLNLTKRDFLIPLDYSNFFRVHFNMEVTLEEIKDNDNERIIRENKKEIKGKRFYVNKIYLNKPRKDELNIKEGDYIYKISPGSPSGVREYIFDENQVEFILNNYTYIFDDKTIYANFYSHDNKYLYNDFFNSKYIDSEEDSINKKLHKQDFKSDTFRNSCF